MSRPGDRVVLVPDSLRVYADEVGAAAVRALAAMVRRLAWWRR